MEQNLSDAIRQFDTGKPLVELDQAVKNETDIITKQFWYLDQMEQLIVEKANIFVSKECPSDD